MASMTDLGRVVADYREIKRFNHHTSRINSLAIRSEGDLLATSGEDDFIHLYDAITGLYKGGATSAKYRVGKVRFAGKEKDELLATSRNAWDHSLRLISIEKNATLSTFTSHRATVNSIEKHPVEDHFFITAAQDDSLRLWDLRSPSCQGFYSVASSHATFDPLGLVIACAKSVPTNMQPSSAMNVDSETTTTTAANSDIVANWNYGVELFDSRKVDGGPFASWILPGTGSDTVSADGHTLLLSSSHSSSVYTIDSFNGDRLSHWYGRKNRLGDEIEAHFSPDGSLITTGSSNGDIFVYQAKTGLPIAHLATSSNSPVLNAKFHPSLSYIASTDTNLSFFSK